MAGIYQIDKSIESELNKQDKIERIDKIFTEPPQKRPLLLLKMAEVYFTTKAIKMPDELYYSDIINPLIYPDNKSEVKKALADIKQYAIEYHAKNSIKLNLDSVSQNTLNKILKKTFYGTRLELTGINGTLSSNIKAGYVPYPALKVIIDRVLEKETPTPDLLIAFESKEKIAFIASKFKELLHSKEA